jgi:serine/threonine protein phosphatase PrpC
MKPPPKDVSVSVFARTDTGTQRPGNEDAFLVADLTTGNVGLGPNMSTHRIGERGSLIVVSDGMGGAVGGEIASAMVVRFIRDELLNPRSEDLCHQLKQATEVANQRIWEYSKENPALTGMGATVTAVLIHDTSAYIAQVGDSRAYLIRGDQEKQLTRDQSLVQALLDSGAIKPDEAGSVAQHVILQAVGTSPSVEVVISSVELCRNDLLLVCTDGLSNKVTPEEMRNTLHSDSLSAACRALVELANARGGDDNITVVAARFDGDALHSAAQSNSITGSVKVLYSSDAGFPRGNDQFSSLGSVVDEAGTTIALNAASAGLRHHLKSTPAGQDETSPKQTSLLVTLIVLLLLMLGVFLVLRSVW